jgi:CubicO group peptidase (beta-lactamase class C family)
MPNIKTAKGAIILMLLATTGTNLLATRPAAAAAVTTAPANDQERAFVADFEAFLSASLQRLSSIPGVAVAVTRSGGPLLVRGYGRADIERGIATTPETRFYIASSTKAFMGLTMALLERRNMVDLDWTLSELAPDVTFAPELRAGEVTLRHLLTHSHGLRSWPIQFRLAFTGEHDAATLWGLLPRLTSNSEAPLGTYAYSNLGYNLAALLVERRLGRRWQDLVEAEVLRPLRLSQTLTEGLERARRIHPVAAPYLGLAPGGPELLSLVKVDSNMQSAGGIYSSVNDLGRWLTLQLLAAKGANGLPLPADVVAATHRPIATVTGDSGPFAATGYGLGWGSGRYQGETLFQAFGGYAGARSHVSFMPARDLGVAIVTNDEGAGAPFIDVAAAYAYDWFASGREAAARRAGAAIDRIAAQGARITERIAADRASRTGRQWQLTLGRAAYAGRFCNGDLGTIVVTHAGDGFDVTMGAMRSRATPFTEPDAIRAELMPNQGMALRFTIENGRATALNAFDTSFRRCG